MLTIQCFYATVLTTLKFTGPSCDLETVMALVESAQESLSVLHMSFTDSALAKNYAYPSPLALETLVIRGPFEYEMVDWLVQKSTVTLKMLSLDRQFTAITAIKAINTETVTFQRFPALKSKELFLSTSLGYCHS